MNNKCNIKIKKYIIKFQFKKKLFDKLLLILKKIIYIYLYKITFKLQK